MAKMIPMGLTKMVGEKLATAVWVGFGFGGSGRKDRTFGGW